MPLEPLAEAAVEALGQVAVEAGGDRVRKRYGQKGCILALAVGLLAISAAVWLLS